MTAQEHKDGITSNASVITPYTTMTFKKCNSGLKTAVGMNRNARASKHSIVMLPARLWKVTAFRNSHLQKQKLMLLPSFPRCMSDSIKMISFVEEVTVYFGGKFLFLARNRILVFRKQPSERYFFTNSRRRSFMSTLKSSELYRRNG